MGCLSTSINCRVQLHMDGFLNIAILFEYLFEYFLEKKSKCYSYLMNYISLNSVILCCAFFFKRNKHFLFQMTFQVSKLLRQGKSRQTPKMFLIRVRPLVCNMYLDTKMCSRFYTMPPFYIWVLPIRPKSPNNLSVNHPINLNIYTTMSKKTPF